MLIPIKSSSSFKLGHVGLKTRSLGRIFEKPCIYSREHSFDPKFMKLCLDVNHHEIEVKLKLGHVPLKTRSRGQIIEKQCSHSRGHSFDQKFMYLCQNDNPHKS